MISELININEITRICELTPVTPNDTALLSAINARYSDTPFKIVCTGGGRHWDTAIVTDNGDRISDSLEEWVDQELTLTNNDARAVWARHKDRGLLRAEQKGYSLFLTAPFGQDPDQFYQLEILCGEEVTTQTLFDPKDSYPPEDRFDLISGHYLLLSEKEQKVLSPARYKFCDLINVRSFVKNLCESWKQERLRKYPELQKKVIRVQTVDMDAGVNTSENVPFLDLCPDWLDREPPGYRLFRDWAESSAGKGGNRFCDHWYLSTGSWKEDGVQQYALIPQWADADGGLELPEISPGWDDSPYGVMEALTQFDKLTGYQFSWYFYALHGNRISSSAAGVIANAVKAGLLNLPKHNETVLMRWKNAQYGF